MDDLQELQPLAIALTQAIEGAYKLEEPLNALMSGPLSVLGMALASPANEGLSALNAILRAADRVGCPCGTHDGAVHVIDLDSHPMLQLLAACSELATEQSRKKVAHALVAEAIASVVNFLAIAMIHKAYGHLAFVAHTSSKEGWPLVASLMAQGVAPSFMARSKGVH